MKKLIICLALAFLLSGCYQTVNITDIKYAIKQCGEIGKIEEIVSIANGQLRVKCDSQKSDWLKTE